MRPGGAQAQGSSQLRCHSLCIGDNPNIMKVGTDLSDSLSPAVNPALPYPLKPVLKCHSYMFCYGDSTASSGSLSQCLATHNIREG